MKSSIFIVFFLIISFATTSTLYAQKKAYITEGGSLYLVNIDSCNSQFIGNSISSLHHIVNWDDIALNPLNDSLYGVSQFDSLYWIDKTNGVQHLIGATVPDVNGLTFGKDGTLYGISGSNNHLFTINPATGSWTNLGAIGSHFDYSYSKGDLAFYNDTLYCLGARSGLSGATSLVKINLGDLSQSSAVGEFKEELMYGIASLGCDMKIYTFNRGNAYRVNSLHPFQYDTLCTNLLPWNPIISGAAGINEDIGVPSVSLGDDQIACLGDTISLNVASSTGQYLWNNGDTIPMRTITQAGDYWVTVRNDSCTTNDTISIAYEVPPTLNLQDTTLCEGQTLVVDLSHYNLNYTWFNGKTSPIFKVKSSGTYSVTVTGGVCNVVLTDAIRLTYKSLPNLSLDTAYNLCIGEQLTLNAYNEDASYLWQDNSTADSFVVTQAGTYDVEVSNYCGSIHKEIEVAENCNCILAIPNAFSPNNDGINDFFRPVLQCHLQKARLRIFNRWGQTVCDTPDITTGWDGLFKGVASPQETYIYLLEFEEINRIPKAIKGELLLID